jgi:hypothetical protein
MRIDDELIDDTLRNAPPWQPSPAFAERVASRGVRLHNDLTAAAPRFWSFLNVAAVVPLAVFTAVAGYFIGGFVDILMRETTARPVGLSSTTWIWVLISYAVAAWFTLRPHPID